MRVDIGSLVLQDADVTGCTVPIILDPTAASGGHTVTCSVNTRALTQADYEAGSMAWTVTAPVTATAHGGNTSINGNYPVTYTHTLTKEPKYTLGVKRVDSNPAAPVAAAGGCNHL